MYQYLIAVFLLLSSSFALAEGDAKAGKDKALICTGCHGADGNNSNSEYPVLAGQVESYLLKQVNDFKSGARVDDHMTSMVLAVEESDFEDIVAYFSSQPINKPSDKNKNYNKMKPGEHTFTRGLTAKSVPACSSCHGSEALGNKELAYPALASQHKEYLAKALKDFREGKRKNDKDKLMRNIAAQLNDEEIEALANYISNI